MAAMKHHGHHRIVEILKNGQGSVALLAPRENKPASANHEQTESTGNRHGTHFSGSCRFSCRNLGIIGGNQGPEAETAITLFAHRFHG